MVDDALLDREGLPFDEWAVTPQPEHLVPDAVEREREREQFREGLRGDPPAVVLTHTDADGLSSAALLASCWGPNTLVQPLDYHGAYRFEHAVEDLLDFDLSGTRIYVSDFNLDEPAGGLSKVASKAQDAVWYDHHQWDDEVAEAVWDSGFDLLIDEDECTASLIAQDLWKLPDRLQELAEVTKDIDLWIREDPRSERLNVFAAMVDDPNEYVATVLECGPGLPDDVQDRIDERLARNEELEAEAVSRRMDYEVDGYDIAMTYIRGGRSSEIGNELVEDHEDDYDIAIVQKPHGGMGIYAHSNREGFARCHEIAEELGGGGHPTAAGCDIPADTFREVAHYWSTSGLSVRQEVLGAVKAVVSDGGDE